MRRFFASAAALLLADQATKALARSALGDGGVPRLLGEALRLRLVHNPGSAFGLIQGERWVFILVSVAAILLVLYLVFSRRYAFPGSSIAFGCILGGALGNLIDRLAHSEVTDFIDMGLGAHRWPTYNVADMGVTLGVIYLAIGFLLLDGRSRAEAPGDG